MEAELNLGDIVEAEVTKITDFGAFAKINGRELGLIHISQISNRFVKDINEHLKIGDKIKVKVIKLGPGKKIDLTLKIAQEQAHPAARQRNMAFNSPGQKDNSRFKSSDFEDKFKKYLRQSQ